MSEASIVAATAALPREPARARAMRLERLYTGFSTEDSITMIAQVRLGLLGQQPAPSGIGLSTRGVGWPRNEPRQRSEPWSRLRWHFSRRGRSIARCGCPAPESRFVALLRPAPPARCGSQFR